MNVYASITDFPLYTSLDTFFHGFKNAGVDGVEIVGGYKSRWSLSHLFKVSEKYELPIVSFHQPIWSGVGVYFDEMFFKAIAGHGVHYVTFHPLTFSSFTSAAMKKYLTNLSNLQEKYDIHVLIENMSNEFGYTKLFDSSAGSMLHHLETVHAIAQEYGFLLTFDISHAEFTRPDTQAIFSQMFPLIGVVHLSSFVHGTHHLPLTQGTFELEPFLGFLKKKDYKGKIILEVNHDIMKRLLLPYDFGAIKDSVNAIRKITDRW